MFGIDDAVAAIVPVIGQVISRVWPDPSDQAKANLALLDLQQSGELAQMKAITDLALGQTEVNKTEAANPSVFVAGWRPAIGWVCAAGVSYSVLIQPLLTWATNLCGSEVVAPIVDTSVLFTLLSGLLGLGAMKSFDMMKGVATTTFSK